MAGEKWEYSYPIRTYCPEAHTPIWEHIEGSTHASRTITILERGDVMKRSYRPSLFAFWGGGIDEEVMQALPVPPFGEGGLMRRSCRIHCDPKRSNVSYRKKLDEANVHARLTAIVIQPTEKRKRRVEPPHRGEDKQKIRLSNHINSWTINSCRGLQPQPAVYTYSGGGNSFLTGCAA